MFRRGLFYSFLSIYLRSFLGLSVTETTFFATFPMIVNIIFQNFICGNVSDKYQKRRTLIILGEFFAAIGTVLTWYFHYGQSSKTTAGYIIIAGLCVIEIFWSMSNLGWTAIISDLFALKERASVRGKLSSIGGFGRIIGVLIGGLAYDGMSYHYEGWGFESGLLFFIAAGVMLLSSIPIFFLPEGGVSKSEMVKNEEEDQLLDKETRRKKVKLFIIFIISMAFINFGRNSIATIKAQFFTLDEGLNLSSQMLSYIVNMRSLATILIGVFIGFMVKAVNERWLLFLGAVLALIHLIGFVVFDTIAVLFFINFLGGVSHVVILATSYAVASEMIPPKNRARLFAIYNATNFLSWGIAGTFIAGPVADFLMSQGYSQVKSYKGSFSVAALMTTMGILILLFFNYRCYKKLNS